MSENFRTVYDRICVFSNPGDPYLDDYKISNDDDGKRCLVKNGKINVYEKIQASRESCDINIILEKYLNIGDPAILNRSPSFYGDVSEIPTNYAELLRLQKEANDYFDSLSPDIKNQFDNDRDVFFSSIGSEKFKNIMNPKPIESEVVNNEQKSE